MLPPAPPPPPVFNFGRPPPPIPPPPPPPPNFGIPPPPPPPPNFGIPPPPPPPPPNFGIPPPPPPPPPGPANVPNPPIEEKQNPRKAMLDAIAARAKKMQEERDKVLEADKLNEPNEPNAPRRDVRDQIPQTFKFREKEDTGDNVQLFRIAGTQCVGFKTKRGTVPDENTFADFETCEDERKVREMYDHALGAITAPVGSLGEEIFKIETALQKLNAGILDYLQRIETVKEEEDKENYRRAIAADVKRLKMAQNRRRILVRDQQKAQKYMNEYIMPHIASMSRKSTNDFYFHLQSINDQYKRWTLDFVSQEFVNYFKIGLPGYMVGDVSVSASVVKRVLQNSRLQECLNDEILEEIMKELGVKATDDSKEESTEVSGEQTPQRSEVARPFKENKRIMRSQSLPDVTRLNILRTGMDAVQSNLMRKGPNLSRGHVNHVIDALLHTENTVASQMEPIESIAPGNTQEKARGIWGRAVDVVKNGKSAVITMGSLLGGITTYTTGQLAAQSIKQGLTGVYQAIPQPLSNPVLTVPVTDAITAITESISHVPVTPAILELATRTSGGIAAVTGTLAAAAATPATAPLAPMAFTAGTGMAAALFPLVVAVVAAGAILFAVHRRRNTFIAYLPDSEGNNSMTMMSMDPKTEEVLLSPLPEELEEEVESSTSFVEDLEFINEHPEMVPEDAALNIENPPENLQEELEADIVDILPEEVKETVEKEMKETAVQTEEEEKEEEEHRVKVEPAWVKVIDNSRTMIIVDGRSRKVVAVKNE